MLHAKPPWARLHWKRGGGVGGLGGGFEWSGCRGRIRRWLRLPHGRHRLPSIVSASGASPGAIGLCIPVLWLPGVREGGGGGGRGREGGMREAFRGVSS